MAGDKGGFKAPGTFTIAIVFLGIFIAFYVMNFKYLSSLWEVH